MQTRGLAALYLAVLLIISQLILPAFGRSEIFPFFDWRLYGNYYRGPHFDLKLTEETGSRAYMLTELGDARIDFHNRIRLWYFAQKAAGDKHQ